MDMQDVWIIIIGALVCGSCGLLGCYLILKRLALMGDAISHAVLPGIVLAVMASGTINSFAIFLGAGIIGILTPLLTDGLKSSKLLDEDASLGAVFTSLFAIGVILVSNVGNVDIDTECVLYGEIAITPLNTWVFNNLDLGPRAFWVLLTVFIANIVFVQLFYKELKICTFDEGLAASMGIPPKFIHYFLMAMVSITTIASFESVGAIIVVAMFIAPGATAYLLTDKFGTMLWLSVLIGFMCSIGGYALSMALGGDVSIAGCMAVVAGVFFSLAFLFSPKYGVIIRSLRKRNLRIYVEEEGATNPEKLSRPA